MKHLWLGARRLVLVAGLLSTPAASPVPAGAVARPTSVAALVDEPFDVVAVVAAQRSPQLRRLLLSRRVPSPSSVPGLVSATTPRVSGWPTPPAPGSMAPGSM